MTTAIVQMLESHPEAANIRPELLGRVVDSVLDCAAICTSCADACLAEDAVSDLRQCIQTDLNCAANCTATAAVITRQTAPNWNILRAQLQACLTACAECARECEQHADHHEHCRLCAESCRSCELICQELLDAIPASS